MATEQPLVVIVGQTASGKSGVAMELAKRHNGAIIAADSRTIYQGMDIGTAKPSAAEQTEVPHYLLDVITPAQRFTAADFKKQASEAVEAIGANGKTPIMVGGTGLYIDSYLYDFSFGASAGKKPLRSSTLIVGLRVPDEVLKQRIAKRVEQMFSDGLEAEVKTLAEQYGWQSSGLSAIGYREFEPYFAGTQTLEETKQKIVHNTWQYARRQRTWFRRSHDIQWCDTPEQALQLAEAFLTTMQQ